MVQLTFSHLSTHFAWNSWLQGKTRSSCLHSKSLKHTTHLREKDSVVGIWMLLPSLRLVWCGKLRVRKDSQRLFRKMILWVESVGRKLLYVGFSESSWFGFSQPLCQVEQRLRGKRQRDTWCHMDTRLDAKRSTNTDWCEQLFLVWCKQISFLSCNWWNNCIIFCLQCSFLYIKGWWRAKNVLTLFLSPSWREV